MYNINDILSVSYCDKRIFRNRNMHARCGFFQSIFADLNSSFQQHFLLPIEDIDFLGSNNKKVFYPQLFFVKFWGFQNCQVSNDLD